MTWADFIVRGTLVLAAGFAASLAFRRASAALRHCVWTAVFMALLAMPLAMRLGPKIALEGWPAGPGARTASEAASVVAPAHAPADAGRATQTRRDEGAYAWFPGVLYLAGLLLVAMRFLAGAVRTTRVVQQARPAPYAQAVADAIGPGVRALESNSAAVPMTWGTLRPVVLLPEAARHWPAERLHAVVLHEIIHVRRHDLLAQVAAQAACCLYWFHPMVWLAAGQLRKERERACDDAVLRSGVVAPDYAGHLLELARVLVERRTLADAPAMAETGDLEERVRAVLDGGRNRTPLSRRLAATVAALACALVLPVALVTLHAQAARGTLAGTVQDDSKARVPGCEVRVKNLDGKNEEVTKAHVAGQFAFANIPAGRYTIEARSKGFAVGKAEVLVEASQRAEALVTLPLGQVSETMTIRGAVPPPPPPAAPGRTPQRITVGGNVQPTKLIRQVRPVIPPDLKIEPGMSHHVLLYAVISITGELLNPKVVNSNVPPALAQAALDAVRQWRYSPTLLNGKPVEVVTQIDVNFDLGQ